MLNEGPLHQALKDLYAVDGAKFEQRIDGFIADVLIGDRIIEIQTGSFHPLQIEFVGLEQEYNVMSKRIFTRLVDEKYVDGWDDCR